MEPLVKLQWILGQRSLYSINFRNAGVGMTFYEPDDPDQAPQPGIDQAWKKDLKTYKYYPDLVKCIDGEFKQLKGANMLGIPIPTLEEAAVGDRQALGRWVRFCVGPANEDEAIRMNLISARFKELGGWDEALSKEIGWAEPK